MATQHELDDILSRIKQLSLKEQLTLVVRVLEDVQAKITRETRPARRAWRGKSRELGTVGEAAEYAAVSEKTIRRMINAGELTGYYPTSHVLRVDMLELAELVESRATRKGVC
ncbi:helix-turn-helix domain-containing protein [Corynebacterium amycolatum]|uniref:helix-turn-helix domain-containing protein n=1 Tax=Corynebacterium amycolatum TaxID=43765 RepID=UPI002119DAE9|nr:helix-turn-helix domain-containing protein [Corynebacterium amycolatum]MCQ9125076.1 helix-turn-helix domain-containing protein [Corynebacterium amycolatum]